MLDHKTTGLSATNFIWPIKVADAETEMAFQSAPPKFIRPDNVLADQVIDFDLNNPLVTFRGA